MEILGRPGTYQRLEHLGNRLESGLLAACQSARVPGVVNRVGSMLTLFFTDQPVTDYASAKRADTKRFGTVFRNLRDRGVFMPPSQFEAMFISLAHTDEDIDQITTAVRASLSSSPGD